MSIKRRDLLKTIGGVTLAAGLVGHRTAAAQLLGESPATAFRFAEDRVPMNAANLCPMPAAISRAVQTYGESLDVDMSDANRRRIMALKEDARSGLARQLGASGDEIAIVRNTSEANNIVVQGIALEQGDEVLLWNQNHPSNDVAWAVRAKRTGCTVRHFDIPLDTETPEQVVELVVGALGPKTRVVSFTHISNVTGFRLPAAEICAAIARADGRIHVHIDGAQTWGVRDLDLERTGCHSFSGSAHKWFMGPREVGLLYVREDSQTRIWPGVVSIPWGEAASPSVAGARRFEALGQRDDASIAALAETVRFHDEIGTAEIERRAAAVADLAREALGDLGVPLVSTLNPAFTSNVIVLEARPEVRQELLGNVLRDGGIILAGVNGLRLSPHVYNTPEHVERVVAAIAKSRRLLG